MEIISSEKRNMHFNIKQKMFLQIRILIRIFTTFSSFQSSTSIPGNFQIIEIKIRLSPFPDIGIIASLGVPSRLKPRARLS